MAGLVAEVSLHSVSIPSYGPDNGTSRSGSFPALPILGADAQHRLTQKHAAHGITPSQHKGCGSVSELTSLGIVALICKPCLRSRPRGVLRANTFWVKWLAHPSRRLRTFTVMGNGRGPLLEKWRCLEARTHTRLNDGGNVCISAKFTTSAGG
ncbi:unnamed protein product [Cercospora beticola]|nr:unnamed protein product [Cercospora beticola]